MGLNPDKAKILDGDPNSMNLDSCIQWIWIRNTKIMTFWANISTKFVKNDSLHPCPVHIVSICAIINLGLNPDKAKKNLGPGSGFNESGFVFNESGFEH